MDITKRMILEQGFQAVAVEADWPAAYRVNRYVQGQGSDASAPFAPPGAGDRSSVPSGN